jgi:Flp pilus assembly protein TadD
MLGALTALTAQDRFLPFHSSLEIATKKLNDASELWSHAHFGKATTLIRMSIAEDPNLFMPYVFLIANNPVDANKEGLIDKALAIDAANFTNAEKILRIQVAKWKKDPNAKSAAAMKALATAYPNNIQALEWASANAGFGDGNITLALEYAQKLAKLSPAFSPNYNMMGYYYLELMEMEKAKFSFLKYLELAPQEANAYDSMGEYYKTVNDFENSIKFYDKAAAMGMAGAKERAAVVREMQ